MSKEPKVNAPPVAPPPAAPASETAAATAVEPGELEALAQGAAPQPDPAAAKPPEKTVSTAELFVMVGGPWFDILAPNWKVSAEEKKALGEAYGALVDKYFPDWETRFGPELACVAVTAGVLGPRLALKIPPRKPEPKPEGKADAASTAQAA